MHTLRPLGVAMASAPTVGFLRERRCRSLLGRARSQQL